MARMKPLRIRENVHRVALSEGRDGQTCRLCAGWRAYPRVGIHLTPRQAERIANWLKEWALRQGLKKGGGA